MKGQSLARIYLCLIGACLFSTYSKLPEKMRTLNFFHECQKVVTEDRIEIPSVSVVKLTIFGFLYKRMVTIL